MWAEDFESLNIKVIVLFSSGVFKQRLKNTALRRTPSRKHWQQRRAGIMRTETTHTHKTGYYLSKDSATSGVSTTLMAPFTSTMAVVLVWAKGCSRVQSSVAVSSSVLSMALLSSGVYGVLRANNNDNEGAIKAEAGWAYASNQSCCGFSVVL